MLLCKSFSIARPSTGADTIISPDSTRLVYVSQGKLFTRRMDRSAAVEVADAEGATSVRLAGWAVGCFTFQPEMAPKRALTTFDCAAISAVISAYCGAVAYVRATALISASRFLSCWYCRHAC